ncbi:MAG: RdgB/HAM1 family non-canonical purine NTP pyrophosphatase [Burkholderiales bacterium]|nr:RdgB/HAM1 family non-canonical purine NTP pyrophosphatase [Burkholderiales bacterium]
MQKIVIASNNQGKIKEFQDIFAKYNIEIIPQSQLNVPEPEEPFETFVENSLLKARHCSKYTGLPSLADDSGLCVDILGGEPGVFSARYAGTPKSDQKNIDKLLKAMQNKTNKDAYFYCSLVFVRHHKDPQPIIADGVFNGQITQEQKGDNGHGYDPIFLVKEYQKTAAELDPETKNKISHRGIAIEELIKKLKLSNLI